MILTTFTNLTEDTDILLITLLIKEITLFGNTSKIEFSLSSQYRQSIEKHNEAVTQNRKIVGQLITAEQANTYIFRITNSLHLKQIDCYGMNWIYLIEN
jgi:hypothetical protein